MHRGLMALLAIGLALVGWSSASRAESRLALVIGIDKYGNLGPGQHLQRAVNDARAVGQTLRGLGFEVTLGENVDRSAFNRMWQNFLDKVTPGDTVTFYFSGHGVEIEGSNFLLPADIPNIGIGRQEQLKRESMSVSEFLLDLKKRRPQVSLVILDACRDNPFASAELRSARGRSGLASINDPPEGTFIMYSAGAGETALDRLPQNDPDKINSVYTRHLLPLLRTPGLTLPDLARQLRQKVNSLASAVPHVQRPAYYDGLIGLYCPAGCEVKGAQQQQQQRQQQPVALSSALTRSVGQRPKVAALLADPGLSSSVDLLGTVMGKIRDNYVELPSDRALMTGAIEEVLRKFGNDKAQAAADRGVGASSGTGSAEYPLIDVFGEVLENVLQNHPDPASQQAIIRAAIDGMLSGIDARGAYFDAAAFAKFRAANAGTFSGTGMEVKKEKDKVKVTFTFEGGPAATAGVLADDLITHINGEPTADMRLEQAVERLRGPAQTTVSVTVVRERQPAPLNLTITRDVLRLRAIRFRLEAGGAVGYIQIRTFNDQTHNSLVQALDRLQKQSDDKINGYVIDLRDNQGGLLDAVIAAADDFLDTGTIATLKGRGLQEVQRHVAKPGDIAGGKKLVLLVNGMTASGAEIFAGALKDHKRAQIVGVASRGAASIQTVFTLGDKGAVRITTSRFYAPNGRSIEAGGIQPDVRVDAAPGKDGDPQLEKAIELLTK